MQSPAQVRPGFALAALRRRAWLIATVTVLGTIGGLLLALKQVPEYQSSATVFLEPLSGNPFSPDTPANRSEQIAALETEAALVRTEQVEERARESAAGDLEGDAKERVRARVPSNSQVLVITYRSNTPESARDGVEAFTEAFLAYRTENAAGAFESRAEALDQQIVQTTEELTSISESLAAAEPESPQASLLQAQAQVLASQIAGLQFELTELRSTPTVPGSVISAASLPRSPTGLPGAAIVAGSAVTALAMGILLALLLEYRDPRIRDDYDLRAIGLARPLASVDFGAGERDRREAFQQLSGAVFARDSGALRICVVAAASSRVRVGPLSAGLAQAAERSGRHVVVVTVDDHDVTGLASQPGAPGLTDVGTHESDFAFPAQGLGSEVSERIVVVGMGSKPTRLQNVLQDPRFRSVLDRLGADADHLVVSSPSIATANGQALARAGDAALLAVEYGHTTFEEVLAAIETLDHHRASLVGVVALRGAWSASKSGRRARHRTRTSPSRSQVQRPPTLISRLRLKGVAAKARIRGPRDPAV